MGDENQFVTANAALCIKKETKVPFPLNRTPRNYNPTIWNSIALYSITNQYNGKISCHHQLGGEV